MAHSNKQHVLRALADTIRRAGLAERVNIIGKAKVPIVKFVTTHGRFSVDISVNQINGVTAGHMMTRFVRELPGLRALVMVIKAFLSQRSMNEVYTGGLGSYSVVCLAISFLQMHPKIRRGEIDPAKNLGVLVVEFFELYGLYFNYQDVGISVRDGGTYYNKGDRGWYDSGQAYLLSIEDPSDPCTFSLQNSDIQTDSMLNSKRHLTGLLRDSPGAADVGWCTWAVDHGGIPEGKHHQQPPVWPLPELPGWEDHGRGVEHPHERHGRHAGGKLLRMSVPTSALTYGRSDGEPSQGRAGSVRQTCATPDSRSRTTLSFQG